MSSRIWAKCNHSADSIHCACPSASITARRLGLRCSIATRSMLKSDDRSCNCATALKSSSLAIPHAARSISDAWENQRPCASEPNRTNGVAWNCAFSNAAAHCATACACFLLLLPATLGCGTVASQRCRRNRTLHLLLPGIHGSVYRCVLPVDYTPKKQKPQRTECSLRRGRGADGSRLAVRSASNMGGLPKGASSPAVCGIPR